jgi:hypothetical protein
VKRAVQLKGIVQRFIRDLRRPVVRDIDPVEVGSGEAQHAGWRERAAAFLEKAEPVVEPQVLEEALGVDGRYGAEREPLADVQDAVHAGKRMVVDVDPADDRLLTASDVET